MNLERRRGTGWFKAAGGAALSQRPYDNRFWVIDCTFAAEQAPQGGVLKIDDRWVSKPRRRETRRSPNLDALLEPVTYRGPMGLRLNRQP
jgi:hypothetical protein